MTKKKFTGTKSVSMSLFLSVAFFIFIGKANMNSFRVCIIVISKHNLKLKVFHVLVGYMRDLLFCVDIFNHALKNKIEHSGNVFCEIRVRFSCINLFFFFFFTVFVKFDAVLSKEGNPPMLPKGDTVFRN